MFEGCRRGFAWTFLAVIHAGLVGACGDEADASMLDAGVAAADAEVSSDAELPAVDAASDCAADVDDDGAPDCVDECLLDPLKAEPGACGCGQTEASSQDGASICLDDCPGDLGKSAPGDCGCGVPDIDRDDDGVADCIDLCPMDAAKIAPGACGCWVPDVDTDGDGTPDCQDGCGLDPDSIEPGPCGCAVDDCAALHPDGDGDGTPDDQDGCPSDGMKIEPGDCGCADAPEPAGLACEGPCEAAKHCNGEGRCGVVDALYCRDFELDSDADGTPDAIDQCADDPARVVPGDCGCASVAAPAATSCADGLCAVATACDGAGTCGSQSACAPDEECTHALHDGKLYWFCEHARSWADAVGRCAIDPGRQLAAIDDAAENAWVAARADFDVWLGGNELGAAEEWRWATPSSGDGPPFWSGDSGGHAHGLYTNWAAGHPAAGSGRAAQLRASDGAWVPADAAELANYVCTKPFDTCPLDPEKAADGVCGCSVPDTDSDADGSADCIDACPDDPARATDGEGACSRVVVISNDVSQSESTAPRSAMDGDGTQLFVWQADVGAGAQLRARRLDAFGVALDPPGRPLILAKQIALGFPAEPAVAGLQGGGWVVAWTDAFADGDHTGIVYLVLAPNGTHSAPRVANQVTALDQASPRVAALGEGFALAWTDTGRAAQSSIVLRTFDARGLPATGEQVMASGDLADQVHPVLASTGSRLILMWTDAAQPAVRARELGSPTSWLVASPGHSPALTSAGDGFVAAWVGPGANKANAVLVTTWLATDVPGTTEAVEAGDPAELRAESVPSVAHLAAGVFLVAWSYATGSGRADFAVVETGGVWAGDAMAELAARALLADAFGQIQAHAAAHGAWLSWIDGGVAGGGSVARGIEATQLPEL